MASVSGAEDVIPDIIGLRIGKLVVSKYLGRRGPRSTQYWECVCDCGGSTAIRRNRLIGTPDHLSRSCGCMRGVYPHKSRPIEERFWELVERRGKDECWPWTASSNPKGYGQFNIGRARAATQKRKGLCHHANRVAFELTFGEIPGDLDVLHSCDNPPCCNPAHLFLGTNADNMRDKHAKGRARCRLGKGQAVEIRRLAANGATVAELSIKFDRMPYSIDAIIRRKTHRRVS